MKLPRKIKRKWLKALRSGEYGQTKGRVTNGKGGFCCLGVLQHVVSGGMCEVYDGPHNDFRAAPTRPWYEANGIECMTGEDTDIAHLMGMNDGDEFGVASRFPTIANWIEKNIETVEGGL